MARRRSGTVTTVGVPVLAVDAAFEYGRRDPVAPESFNRSQSNPNVDWAGLVGQSENSNGFRATNPNGTLCESGGPFDTWNSWGNRGNGRRWNGNVDWAKNGGNRTGE